MKILHVISTLGSGGAEKMLVDIINEMNNYDINCEVAVLTKSDNFFGDKLALLNVPIYYGKTQKVYSFSNIRFLSNILRENEYDCIHTHLFAPQLYSVLASLLVKNVPPLVTTEHNTYNKRRDNKIFYLLDYLMYKKYKKIIAITDETKKSLISYLPFLNSKTTVIPNGVDINFYTNTTPIDRKALYSNAKDTDILVLMVAAMREQKDYETVIRASRLLSDSYKFIFVGDGERMNQVKNYAKDIGSNNIHFLGHRKDVAEIMKTSDIFVLSSKWEGFGLVVVEAAASGLPIIASDVPGMSKVVQSIEGELFEPYNETDLAKKISNTSITGRKYNLSNYSIDKTVRGYLDVYKQVIDKEKR